MLGAGCFLEEALGKCKVPSGCHIPGTKLAPESPTKFGSKTTNSKLMCIPSNKLSHGREPVCLSASSHTPWPHPAGLGSRMESFC